MLKNKIYKYLTLEILKSFITVLFAFTTIAWTVRAVSFLDLIVENGHSVSTYLLFASLNLTNIVTKFMPLSFLIALLLSIIKFERQNELLILWTVGVNKTKLVNLFFLISLFILFIQILFSTYITPNALLKSRSLIKTSNFNSIASIIKENDFSDSFNNITFFIGERSDNKMKNIFIRDDANILKSFSEKEDYVNTTIIASEGYFTETQLVLIDGIIQSRDQNGKLNNINFTKTRFNLKTLKPRTISVPKLQETQTSFLIKCINENEKFSQIIESNCPSKDNIKSVVETVSRRFGMPLYIPLVCLIYSFVLVSHKKKKINFMQRYIYFIISFFVLVLAEILVRYSGFSNIHTVLYFIIPIVLMPLTYLLLIRKFLYEKVKKV